MTIGNSVKTIGAFAFFGSALTSVIIPDGVTTIGDSAFRGNDLTSLTIGNSVTTIGNSAFSINALTSVIIPARVESIETSAFSGNALTSAAFEGDFGDFYFDMFYFNPDLATITYCAARTGWSQGFINGSTIITAAPVECATAPPDAPTIDSIEPGNGEAVITFTPGADNGSSITGYTAYCFGDTLAFGMGQASPITVLGLTNGQAYVCATTATNDFGASPASAFAPVTPVAPPPGC